MTGVPPSIVGNAGRATYDTNYQISPIVLQGGIVGGNAFAPISRFTAGLSPNTRFVPVVGASVVSQSIGMYPFANQYVAANATIQQPLTISIRMISPVDQPGGYATKNQSFMSLATSLQNHNAAGGVYFVATPAYTYSYVVMTAMTDVTVDVPGGQQQIEWQMDFIQPILTISGALAAQNRLLSLLSGGQQVTPNASGAIAWTGQPGSGQATSGNPATLAALQTPSLSVNVNAQ